MRASGVLVLREQLLIRSVWLKVNSIWIIKILRTIERVGVIFRSTSKYPYSSRFKACGFFCGGLGVRALLQIFQSLPAPVSVDCSDHEIDISSRGETLVSQNATPQFRWV